MTPMLKCVPAECPESEAARGGKSGCARHVQENASSAVVFHVAVANEIGNATVDLVLEVVQRHLRGLRKEVDSF